MNMLDKTYSAIFTFLLGVVIFLLILFLIDVVTFLCKIGVFPIIVLLGVCYFFGAFTKHEYQEYKKSKEYENEIKEIRANKKPKAL